jgi:MFS family permease
MAVESTELHHLRATTTRNDPQDVAEASEDATTQALQVQELHPVDRGFHAYWFLASAMFTDAIVYGQPGSYGVFLEWYLSHPPFQGQSPALISFVGTIALAIQYFEMLLLVPLIRRYPDKVKPAMVVALVVQVACYVGASFSTQNWQLVLLQGVLVGISGGVLTVPQFVYIADWFDEKRGTASGLMLAGTGLGGTVLPVVMGAILDKLGYAAALRIWVSPSESSLES